MREEKYKKIFQKIEHIIRHSGSIEENIPFSFKDLYDKWYENKFRWIQRMPDLIYELPDPVTFHISESGKKRLFENFCALAILDDYPDLYEFLDHITTEEFFNKYLNKDFKHRGIDNNYNIKKGTRIIKAFKFFVQNDNDLKFLQSEASRIIQKDSITGRFCLSIHPIDFISASENISNWHSCHALDGIYRSGNLSYIADKVTLMCYLRSNDDVILPNFPSDTPWNNKKWRMLIHIDEQDHIAFTSRQYPFETEGVYDYLTKILNLVCRDSFIFWGRFDNDYIQTSQKGKDTYPLIPLGSCAFTKNKIIKQVDYNLAYVDLLFADRDPARWAYGYAINKIWFINEEPIGFNDLGILENVISQYRYDVGYTTGKEQIQIGEKVLCPICHKSVLMDGSLFVCENCYKTFWPHEAIHYDKYGERL